MIALTLTLLFAAAALIALTSLADSAVRGRNAWRSIRAEMVFEQSSESMTHSAEVVAFQNIKPARIAARNPIQPLFAQPLASAA